jgi:hypothetical protein
MKNIRVHIDVGKKIRNFVTLLYYLMVCCAAVLASAPVDNNLHSVTLTSQKWVWQKMTIKFTVSSFSERISEAINATIFLVLEMLL